MHICAEEEYSHNDKTKWIPWLRSWFHQCLLRLRKRSHTKQHGRKFERKKERQATATVTWRKAIALNTHHQFQYGVWMKLKSNQSTSHQAPTTWINSYLVLMFMIILYLLPSIFIVVNEIGRSHIHVRMWFVLKCLLSSKALHIKLEMFSISFWMCINIWNWVPFDERVEVWSFIQFCSLGCSVEHSRPSNELWFLWCDDI